MHINNIGKAEILKCKNSIKSNKTQENSIKLNKKQQKALKFSINKKNQ